MKKEISKYNSIQDGSCLCEKIKFSIEGSFDSFYLCHCKYCQKSTGTAHAANIFSSSAKVTWNEGEGLISHFHLPNTRHAKNFCSQCGSPLPISIGDGKLICVPVGSLSHSPKIRPTAHLFIKSKAEWENHLEGVKRFDRFPGSATADY